MRIEWMKAGIVALGVAAGSSASAQQNPSSYVAERLGYFEALETLGEIGLLRYYSSDNEFGDTNVRISQYRAASALVAALPFGAPVPNFSYETTATIPTVDVNAFLTNLPNGRPVALRFTATRPSIESASGNPTDVEVVQERIEVALQYFPSPRTMFSFAVFRETADISLLHAGANIDVEGHGIRADLLHRFSQHWGVALRAEVFDGTEDTRIPLGPTTTLTFDLPQRRLYAQANLVGHYTSEDISWLPEQWALKPEFGLIWQQSRFDPVTNSLGGTSTGTVGDRETVGIAQAGLRIENASLAPQGIKPYFGVMFQHEFINDFDAVFDDPNSISVSAGARIGLGRAAFLNLQAMHSESLDGRRSSTSFLAYANMVF